MPSSTDPRLLQTLLGELDARLRAFLSLERFSLTDPAQSAALEAFVQHVPFSVDAAKDGTALELSLSSDIKTLRMCITGATGLMFDGVGALFASLGVDPASTRLLSAFLNRAEPSRLGCWVELHADGADVGWHIEEPLPLPRALALVKPSADLAALIEWAKAQGTERCTRLTRSAASPVTELRLSLGENRADALELLEGAFSRFAMDDAEELMTTLREHPPEEALELALVFDDQGLVERGVVACAPPTELTLVLTHALAHDAHLEDRARVEATLGVERPVAVSWTNRTGGAALNLDYRLEA